MVQRRSLGLRSSRGAFTLVELLVVMAIIGLMVGVLLPAVQSARESARLTQCVSNLRQIGLATLQHHDAVEAFPPARLRARNDFDSAACESTQPSWLVRLLPYLEESSAASRWDPHAPFESHDAAVREYVPSVYVCPTRRRVEEAVLPTGEYEETVFFPCGCSATEMVELSGGAVGDYAANHGDDTGGTYAEELSYWRGGNGTGTIISSRPLCRDGKPAGWIDRIRIKDILDGTSHTALAGEMHVPFDRLTQPPENGPMYNGKDLPAFARIAAWGVGLARGGDDDTVPAVGFGSWHPGVCPFAMADGAVRLVGVDVESETLRSMCRRNEDYEVDYSKSRFF